MSCLVCKSPNYDFELRHVSTQETPSVYYACLDCLGDFAKALGQLEKAEEVETAKAPPDSAPCCLCGEQVPHDYTHENTWLYWEPGRFLVLDDEQNRAVKVRNWRLMLGITDELNYKSLGYYCAKCAGARHLLGIISTELAFGTTFRRRGWVLLNGLGALDTCRYLAEWPTVLREEHVFMVQHYPETLGGHLEVLARLVTNAVDVPHPQL